MSEHPSPPGPRVARGQQGAGQDQVPGVAAFDLSLPARIAFGAGRATGLAPLVRDHGRRVLAVTGSRPERVADVLDPVRVTADAIVVVPVSGEPTVEDARRAAHAARGIDADVVVAVGGGSVIDLAKAAALLVANGGDPMDYIEVVGRGRPITVAPLPLIALPTTSGTGAEVTANAVLSVPEHKVKASLRHPMMVPRHAVVDPLLTVACPPAVTAAAGMDALTQCLEPYVSRRANPATDGWARTGVRAAAAGLVRAYRDGSDVDARTQMSLASLMGGLALANAKLGAVHGFAGVIGGMTHAPHGAICAALLPHVSRVNLSNGDTTLTGRYADLARWLTGDPGARGEDGIAWIEQTCAALDIPRLGSFGLTESDTALVVAGAERASSTAGNPVTLTAEELSAIFISAL